MNNLTNEQIRAILYSSRNTKGGHERTTLWDVHNLSDLREILALRERVERLGQWANEIQGLIYQNTREPECCGQGYGECCGNFIEGYPKWVEELPQPPQPPKGEG